jgi:hypothetical protein
MREDPDCTVTTVHRERGGGQQKIGEATQGTDHNGVERSALLYFGMAVVIM